MDKRKYLNYAALILFPNFLSLQIFANSAWLPEKGKYKVSISTAITDDNSKDAKQARIDSFKVIEERIDLLIEEIMILEKTDKALSEKAKNEAISAKRITIEQVKALKRELQKLVPFPISNLRVNTVEENKIIEEKAKIIAEAKKQKMNYLKEILCRRSAYQQKRMSTAFIEYAPRDNMSFGIKSNYQENTFTDSKYTSAKSNSNVKTMEMFYKYKIFQNENFIFTVQPKFIYENQSDFKRDKIFHEIGLLSGITKKIGKIEVFTQAAFVTGGGSSKSARNRKYYSYEYMEGVKFPYGITATKFTKYSSRTNYGPIYSKNIYEQFSVAKKIEFGKLKRKNFTIQIGYFQDYDPQHPMYETSGGLFSLWSEI